MQKNKTPNHLKDLLLLFAIPIGIALFAVAAIYVPRLFAQPSYDFIYTQCGDYRCDDNYSVDAFGRLVKEADDMTKPEYRNSTSTIHYYDAAKDATRTIGIEEAQQFKLNTSSKSPDGYSLAREEHQSGFLFWSDNDEAWYLKDGAKKKKIELANTGSYYSQNIKFLGWVEK